MPTKQIYLASDSINLAGDTVKASIDSLSKDTITNLPNIKKILTIPFQWDSIQKIDFLQLIDTSRIDFNRGFIGINIPTSQYNESWVFLVLISLFILTTFSITRSRGWLTETVKNYFKTKDRSSIFSKATVNDTKYRFIFLIFSTFTISFLAYKYSIAHDIEFRFNKFCLVLAIISSYIIAKHFISSFFGYIFLDKNSHKQARESYYNLFIFTSILVFPFIIIQTYSLPPLSEYAEIASLIVLLIAVAVFIAKLFLIFFKNLISSFYIILYLCTLEILPLIFIIKAVRIVATDV